jgi:hypothetical protein
MTTQRPVDRGFLLPLCRSELRRPSGPAPSQDQAIQPGQSESGPRREMRIRSLLHLFCRDFCTSIGHADRNHSATSFDVQANETSFRSMRMEFDSKFSMARLIRLLSIRTKPTSGPIRRSSSMSFLHASHSKTSSAYSRRGAWSVSRNVRSMSLSRTAN